MAKALEGIKVVEIGAAVAMPIAGMLMGSWGADVVHVEAPGEGDMQRYSSHRLGAWTQYSEINYLWEHVDRNKKSICINLASPDPALYEKSCAALGEEIDRCAALGIPYLVTHPGSHMGSGEAEGIARRMTYVELSVSRSFMDEYMSALFLPHTNLDAFPTVKHQMRKAKTWYAPE